MLSTLASTAASSLPAGGIILGRMDFPIDSMEVNMGHSTFPLFVESYSCPSTWDIIYYPYDVHAWADRSGVTPLISQLDISSAVLKRSNDVCLLS